MIDGPEWKIIRLDGTPMPTDEFASVRALREQRVVEHIEMGIVNWQDKITWISVTAAPLPLTGYGVVISFADIGARKHAEEALREREELFSSIVGQAMDSIILIDSELRFVEFNSAAHEGLGYTREEFSTLTIPDIEAEHSVEWIRHNLQQVRALGGLEFETKHRHRNGEIRDVRESLRSLCIRGMEYFAAVWTDITERKRAEEVLLRVNRDLDRTVRELKEKSGHLEEVNLPCGCCYGRETRTGRSLENRYSAT